MGDGYTFVTSGRNKEERTMMPMSPILRIGSTMVLTLLAFYFCYLAWFQPERLRKITIKIINTLPPLASSRERHIGQLESEAWLSERGQVTTTALLLLIPLDVFLFYQLVAK